ncbi:hypothetical protein BHM03_00052819 [Ensete ventricosum]|nr:hypothetical protein BHM03_00052819 [Ensete ventricosum]
MLRPGVTQKWVDEGELPRERTKNRRWRRPYDVLAEATHREVVVRVHQNLYAIEMSPRGDMVQWIVVVERGEEATMSSKGLNYPKSKVSVRKEVDSEERHSAAEVDLPIAKEGT